jgi:DNA-binding IclR family transcriptional regulator
VSTKRLAKTGAAGVRSRGVQSVETAFAVLRSLLGTREARSLSALANESGIPAAKVHRYLVSLINVGMVVQEPGSGRYDLGPLAVQLGITSLSRFDPVRYAISEVGRLRDEIDETVSVIVWGVAGPTVVRTENSMHDVALTMRIGATFPVPTSASGVLFLTFLPPEATARHRSVGPTSGKATISPKRLAASEADARRRRLTRTVGGVLSGVSALAAPVFDEDGHIAAVITAYGRSATFEVAWDGRVARALSAFATQLSSIRRGSRP